MNKLYLLAGSLLIVLVVALVVLNRDEPPQSPNTNVAQDEVPLTERGCVRPDGQLWNFAEEKIQIGSNQVLVAVADTHEEKQKGLGNCPALPENAGMYFVFQPAGVPTFWMKDTLVPLDIVWVAEGKVIGVNQEVSTEPGVADAALKRYKPDGAVDGAIELTAGMADRLGIAVGQEVQKGF